MVTVFAGRLNVVMDADVLSIHFLTAGVTFFP